MTARKPFFALSVLLLFCTCCAAGSDLLFIENGFLLQVDPENMELSVRTANPAGSLRK